MISPYSRMKKRTSQQISDNRTTKAGMTLNTGMIFLPFIPLNKKSRWSIRKINGGTNKWEVIVGQKKAKRSSLLSINS